MGSKKWLAQIGNWKYPRLWGGRTWLTERGNWNYSISWESQNWYAPGGTVEYGAVKMICSEAAVENISDWLVMAIDSSLRGSGVVNADWFRRAIENWLRPKGRSWSSLKRTIGRRLRPKGRSWSNLRGQLKEDSGQRAEVDPTERTIEHCSAQ